MNTLVWTYNPEITSEVFSNHSNDIHNILYINYYRLSIISAYKLGYDCVIYTTKSQVKNFSDLNVEIILLDNIDSKLFDFIKVKVLESRTDNYILIDGDLILNKRLNIPSDVSVVYEHIETKSWDMIYSKCVDSLIKLDIGNFITEWSGVRRNNITNCGLLYFNDINFKNLYIKKWHMINEFVKNNVDVSSQVEYSATSAQYLLTELIDYYKIKSTYFSNTKYDNSYTHYYGDIKFNNPIVPLNNIIKSHNTQII